MLVCNLGVGVNLFVIYGKYFVIYYVDYINFVILDCV